MTIILADKKIAKPTPLNILWGAFAQIITSRFLGKSVALPQKIGDFEFQSEIPKADNAKNMAMGIYTRNNKKYFVKRWEGKIKDLGYYFLVNEYLANAVLSKSVSSETIKIPAIEAVFRDKKSFSVALEFIDGKTLDEFSSEYQCEILQNAINFFSGISPLKSELSLMCRRSAWFYLALLPGISFFVVLRSPKDYKQVMSASFRSLWVFLKTAMRGHPYVLAHRDLLPRNIMISAGISYILDLGTVALTIPGYDYAYILATPGLDKNIIPSHEKNRTEYTKFLKKYIILHHILGSGDYLNLNRRYLDKLYESSTGKEKK